MKRLTFAFAFAFAVSALGACGHSVDLNPTNHSAVGGDAGVADAQSPAATGHGSQTGDPPDAAVDCTPIKFAFSSGIDTNAWSNPDNAFSTETDKSGLTYGVGSGLSGSAGAYLRHTGTVACGVDVSAKFRVQESTASTTTLVHVDVTSGTVEVRVNPDQNEISLATSVTGVSEAINFSGVATTNFTAIRLVITARGAVTLTVSNLPLPGANADVGPLTTPPIISVGAYHAADVTTVGSTFTVDVDALVTVP
jgi:hypothetical protein